MAAIPYFTSEPVIKRVLSDSVDIAHYDIARVTGMTNDNINQAEIVYSGQCYAPALHNNIDFGGQLRSMIDTQVTNIKTLQFKDSQNMGLTQGAFTFNSYFKIIDGTGDDNFYSILYDTRGITAREAGARSHLNGPGNPYPANSFPDPNIMQGQYVSIMYRYPSNFRADDIGQLGITYCYITAQGAGGQASHEQISSAQAQINSASKGGIEKILPPDPSVYDTVTVANKIINSKLAGQSFRYSGPADWQDFADGHGGVLWARFWVANSKGTKTYLTPYLYPKWCEEPNIAYLYFVNSKGGIDFIRGVISVNMQKEKETYETNANIDNRFAFGEEVFHQRRWNSYELRTSLIVEDESYNMADICNARWAWLYIPGDIVPWRSVKIDDTSATVKTNRNTGHKLFNYVFQISDATKSKIV